MTGAEVIDAISAAFKIVKEAPDAQKAAHELDVDLDWLEAEIENGNRAAKIREDDDYMMPTRFHQLEAASEDYNQKKGTWDQAEREEKQKEIAFSAWTLLANDERERLLKDVFKSYDVVKSLFRRVYGGLAA